MHRRIAAATVIVMASVFLSRVLGLGRDWAIAHQIGANASTDAYNAAFTLPDFLNYLIAGGSLSITFIPVFAKYVAENNEEEGWRIFSTVVTVMGFVLVALVATGELLAGPIVGRLIAPGFSPLEHARAVFLTRLMLPAQIFFYEGSILSAVQYAKGQFVVPSLAPLVYNLLIIVAGLALSARIGITGFAVGVLLGAVLGNFLLQVYGAVRAGAKFAPNFRVGHPGFRMFLHLSIPIMLALGLTFADDWISRHYASYLQSGAITWLYYAKNLMRVPLGLVGQAIGVASFPILAQLYSEQKYDELNRILNGTFKALIVLLVPISAFMVAESEPLVRLVFLRTRLHGSDYAATAAALVYFSLGLFAWGAQNILARGFYATRNTIVPAVVGTLTTVLSLPAYVWLMHRMAHLGLALASSLGISAYTVLLFFLLARRTQNQERARLVAFFLKVTAASVIAGSVCWRLALYLEGLMPWQRPPFALLLLTMDTAVGVAALLVLLKLLRVQEVGVYLRGGLAMFARRAQRATASR